MRLKIKMIKVRILFVGYLKSKYLADAIELNYKKPVNVHTVLKEAKISLADVWLIKVKDTIVKEDYVLFSNLKMSLKPVPDRQKV
jgi:hemerythrin-like domain-containing protein